MAIREHPAEVEGGEKIPREVEIAVHVSFADARLVHGEEGLPAPRRSEGDAEGRTVAEPHAVHGAVQQLEIEGRRLRACEPTCQRAQGERSSSLVRHRGVR